MFLLTSWLVGVFSLLALWLCCFHALGLPGSLGMTSEIERSQENVNDRGIEGAGISGVAA